jgi:hypothetical protein
MGCLEDFGKIVGPKMLEWWNLGFNDLMGVARWWS